MTTIDEYAEGFTEESGYLDFARLGPPARAVVDEERMQVEFLSRARFGSLDNAGEHEVRVRESVGALTGFRPDQVTVQPDTSTGLLHTMFGLRGEIALSPDEYPSMRYAAVRAQQALGTVTPVWLETEYGRVTPGTLRDQLTQGITAVAVSLVDYRTGYLADLEGIRQVIGDRLLIVDAVQGFGVVDAPWEVADVIASGGQKWVRAGMGTGFLALSDRAAEQLVPLLSGWTNGAGISNDGISNVAVSNGGVADVAAEAASFRISYGDPLAAARFAAALEGIETVGVDLIAATVADRVARILDLADEFAIPVTSPRSEMERAGIVVLTPDADQFTVLAAAFYNHGVSVTQWGGSVRLSAHVSTSEETFALLRAALLGFASATTA